MWSYFASGRRTSRQERSLRSRHAIKTTTERLVDAVADRNGVFERTTQETLALRRRVFVRTTPELRLTAVCEK